MKASDAGQFRWIWITHFKPLSFISEIVTERLLGTNTVLAGVRGALKYGGRNILFLLKINSYVTQCECTALITQRVRWSNASPQSTCYRFQSMIFIHKYWFPGEKKQSRLGAGPEVYPTNPLGDVGKTPNLSDFGFIIYKPGISISALWWSYWDECMR